MKKSPFGFIAVILSAGLLIGAAYLAPKFSPDAEAEGSVSTSSSVGNYADVYLDPFYNFRSWPQSDQKKSSDTLSTFIYQLKGPITYNWQADSSQNLTFLSVMAVNPTSSTMIDMNGDGLTDMLYREQYYSANGSGQPGYWGAVKLGMWLNQGNNSYRLNYKCVFTNDGVWFGDCAAT